MKNNKLNIEKNEICDKEEVLEDQEQDPNSQENLKKRRKKTKFLH